MIKNVLIFFTLFIIGFTGIIAFRIIQVRKSETNPYQTEKSSFKLQPPLLASEGKISSLSGVVRKFGRDDDDFHTIENGVILQGERLRTEKDSRVTVDFESAQIILDGESEVGFVDTIPSEFLIKQVSGKVVYKAKKTGNTVSIRDNIILVSLSSGQVTIANDNDRNRIKISINGEVKVAFVNKDNKTKVWDFRKGNVIVDLEKKELEVM